MAKLDSKKIASALKNLENAAKGAVRSLNEMTDNEFASSDFEKEPLANVGFIMNTLQNAKRQAESVARFEGLDDDEVAEMLATERETERETLQRATQEKLEKRRAALEPVVVEDETDGEGAETGTGNEDPEKKGDGPGDETQNTPS